METILSSKACRRRVFETISAVALLFLSIVSISGCASIVTGQNQPVSVETRDNSGNQVVGALCKCINDKGTYFINTPGTVMLRRSYDDLHITCTKEQNEPGIAVVKSGTKGMTAGNCLFGGLIGIAVDAGTGAAYDYPSLITVIMGQSIKICPPEPETQDQGKGTNEIK